MRRSRARGERRPDAAAGFTLIEAMVAMSIFGVIVAIAVGGLRVYTRSAEHRGTAREVVSTLRKFQVRAVSEARTYCVTFDTVNNTYTAFRPEPVTPPAIVTCGAPGVRVAGPLETQGSATLSVVSPGFTQANGAATPYVVFTPRGTASPGGLEILRAGTSKVFRITVEGLTARVSLES